MRILIADDNRLIRRGVAALLLAETEWEICGEASDGSEALQKTLELRPDLVLLDISMPGASGLETARLLRQKIQGIKILMMSHYDPAQTLAGALAAGADGCVDKAKIASDLVRAIKNVAAHQHHS